MSRLRSRFGAIALLALGAVIVGLVGPSLAAPDGHECGTTWLGLVETCSAESAAPPEVTASRGGPLDLGSSAAAQASRPGVLWRAEHERGDLSEWSANDCGGQFNNGAAFTEVTGASRRGDGGLRLVVPNLNTGVGQGARAFRWCEAQQHRALYYSAWYYIPQVVRVRGWWWFMEWKSEGSYNAKFGLAVENHRDGRMYVALARGADSGGGAWRQDALALPARRWVHVEAYYEKTTTPTGQITVWQDGNQILAASNLATANSDDLGWAVVNYGQDVSPAGLDIFVDDAAIGTRRLGP